ncbi:auxin-responsive protein SAUR32-like [Abrus precatorius]|uniref:Auxin-responsive protein SAUR32-like n=1 Tax=Abrus precatorius TaxID=3816 RepID=A0A8B8K0X8_ABRPR|nr:auxin-responsive protein SAUR32-like [Abrus precatorius]
MLESGEYNFEEVPVTNHHCRRRHHPKKKVIVKDIPKGFLPIKVGQGEEQHKIMVPVMYLNHPLFSQLLKEAEEEYGFDQQGTIIIPCHVEEFRYVQDLINRDKSPQHHHHHHVISCFRPSRQQDQI